MKLFRLTIGHADTFAAAESKEDMMKRKSEVDPSFAWLPVEISEVVLESYEITVTAKLEDLPAGTIITYRDDQKHLITMSRDELKFFLTEHGVTYVPQWGDKKLLELALTV